MLILFYLSNIIKNEGFFNLYRGVIPPLIGMGIEKGTIFTVYNNIR